jgi:hypothetical protein
MIAQRVPLEEFDQTLHQTVANNDKVFVLFFGKLEAHHDLSPCQ